MAPWATSLLPWSVGILSLLAILLLARSLFWDRGRKNPRCPCCWYDMAGAGLQCPECGYEPRSERDLHRPRRRRRPAALAAVLLAVAYILWCLPRIQTEGWGWGLTPTSGLLAATWTYRPFPELAARNVSRSWRLIAFERIQARHARGLWTWQHDIYLKRWVLPRLLETPKAWPQDHPLVIDADFNQAAWGALGTHSVLTPLFDGALPIHELPQPREPREARRLMTPYWMSTLYEVGIPIPSTYVDFELEIFNKTPAGAPVRTYRTILRRRIMVAGKLGTTKTAVSGPDVQDAMHGTFRWTVENSRYTISDIPGTLDPLLKGVTIGYRIDVLHRGTVIGSARWYMLARQKDPVGTAGTYTLTGDVIRLAEADSNDPEWRVRITGDPEMALLELNSDKYWEGVIEMPLSEAVEQSLPR